MGSLTRLGGREVLERVKDDAELGSIPIVILTASRAEQDLLRSYRLPVSCYLRKPVDLDQFRVVVQSIDEFWFTVVRVDKSA